MKGAGVKVVSLGKTSESWVACESAIVYVHRGTVIDSILTLEQI